MIMRYLSLYLASAIIVIFLLQQLNTSLTSDFELKSEDVAKRPWILVTSIFLHFDLVHLLYNLFALALFGTILESKIGSRKFLLIFFASGIFASIASVFFYETSLGASGAIFGIIGALAVISPMMVVWVSFIPMPMFIAAAVWAIGDLLGILIPSNVANAAHLAGLALGLFFGIAFRKKSAPRKKKDPPAISKKEMDEWEEKYMGY